MRRTTAAWGLVAALLVGAGASWAGEWAKAWMGEISAEKVNVRAGIGENYAVLMVAKQGDHVIVVEEKMGWCRIVVPTGVKCWVSRKFVTRGDGATGTVSGDRVNVRSESNTSNTSYVLGQLAKGATLAIHEEKGEFYRVTPPEGTSFAWIAKKFLKNMGPYEAAKAKIDAEVASKKAADSRVAAAMSSFNEAMVQEKVIDAQPLDVQDFSAVISAYENVAAEKGAGDLCVTAEARLKDLRPRQQALDEYHHTLAAMRQAEAKHAQEMAELKAPVETQYLAIGVVDSFGKLINDPGATHKLLKGGKVLYFMKSDGFNLNQYLNRLVGIQGTISDAAPGYEGFKVVTVTEIVPLDTPAPQPAVEEQK